MEKGYIQKEGMNYENTFSPVAMLESIRIFLVVARKLDYEIWQMDVKTTFLNGNLEKGYLYVKTKRVHSQKARTHGMQVPKFHL